MRLVLRIPAAVIDFAAAALDAAVLVRLVTITAYADMSPAVIGIAGSLVGLAIFPALRWSITGSMAVVSRLPFVDIREREGAE